MLKSKYSLNEVIYGSSGYLKAIAKATWPRGGGDPKFHALKNLVELIEKHMEKTDKIERMLEEVLEKLGEMSEKNSRNF